jgi:hypothetical protein
MADFVVGASLKAYRGGSLANSGSLVTTPIPFSGLRSIDCGARGSLNGLYLPSLGQFEYSFYNDFTIECFLRGDGTTNDGGFLSFDINLPTGEPNKIYFMIEGDELQLNNYEFPGRGYQTKIGVDIGTRTTTDWYHFACVRKDNKYSLFWNGNRVAYDVDSAGNGTADTINIQSDDAYLFKPMGGNNPTNKASLQSVLLGSGGGKPSDQSGSFHWGGYIANYRTSYIAQYDPSSSTYTVPSAAFSDFSGTTTYYKDATNNDFYNESDNLPTTFNDLVLENASVGDVTVEVIPGVVAFPTGVSASTSLGDLIPDSEVVGVSLKTYPNNGSGVAGGGTSPSRDTGVVPFTGVTASYDVGNTANKAYKFLPSPQAALYPFYGDFTIECFIRGDGTSYGGRFLGLSIQTPGGSGGTEHRNLSVRDDISGPAERIVLYNEDTSIADPYENDLVSTDIPDTNATTWYHFALVRKNNKYSMFWNGNRVAHNIDSAGNGTVNGGGTINIDATKDAYLFKPFGGNNPANQNSSNELKYGTGQRATTEPVLAGYIANIRTSFIAQYDPEISILSVPTAPFDADASGQDFYDKGDVSPDNASTTLPQSFNDLNFTASLGSVSVEVAQEVLANGSLLQAFEGTVDLSVELDPIVPTGQNLTTSLGTAAAGPGILVPTTGQNLTVSLGSVTLPVSWGNVSTGTTSTWTPVDTGENAIGP